MDIEFEPFEEECDVFCEHENMVNVVISDKTGDMVNIAGVHVFKDAVVTLTCEKCGNIEKFFAKCGAIKSK